MHMYVERKRFCTFCWTQLENMWPRLKLKRPNVSTLVHLAPNFKQGCGTEDA